MVKVKEDYITYLEFPYELYDLGENYELEIQMKEDRNIKYYLSCDEIIQVDDDSLLFWHKGEVIDLEYKDILNIISIRNYDNYFESLSDDIDITILIYIVLAFILGLIIGGAW